MSNRASKDLPSVHAARLRRQTMAVQGARCAALLGILLTSQVATAEPTFTVNSFLDQQDDLSIPGTCHTAANTCTLRAAIMQANLSSAGATIVLPAGLYLLTMPPAAGDGESTGDLNLRTPASGSPLISIVGAGAATTLIDGNQLDRVFHVEVGRPASISGVTVRNGFVPDGGGIYNQGSLTLSNVTISGNQADFGGGIYSLFGQLTLRNSTVSGNQASNGGGGINSVGDLNVRFSTIQGNSTLGYGGGIVTGLGLTMLNSTVSGNQAGIDAGGIYNSSGSMVLVSSTITQNSANGSGGGLYNVGTANVYSTTIVFNGADADRDGGSGAGVFNEIGRVFNLRNTLVAGNDVGNTPIYDECTGTLNSYGRNLFGADAACTIQTASGSWGHLNGLNTLSPFLLNNGGPTSTVALLPGSNAIDGGDPFQGCVDYNGIPITTDQRGAPRVTGLRCDIGAFEVPEPGLALMLGCGVVGLTGMGRKRRDAPALAMI